MTAVGRRKRERNSRTEREEKGKRDKSVTNGRYWEEAHGVKMPTNFTVVPVKDNTRKAKKADEEEDLDDNNVLREEEENATGEIRYFFFLARWVDN